MSAALLPPSHRISSFRNCRYAPHVSGCRLANSESLGQTAARDNVGRSGVGLGLPVRVQGGSRGVSSRAEQDLPRSEPKFRPLQSGCIGAVSSLTGSGPRMLTRLLFTFAALALFPDLARPQSPDIPAALALPQGAMLLGQYAAKGVQIYVCRVKGAANEWDFKAPEAELLDAQGRPFAKHYAGPTWEAPDGSKAVGKVLANEPAPKTGAIPWLLLSAQSSASGRACRRALRPASQHLRRSRADRHVSDGRRGAACRLHGRLHLLQVIRFAGVIVVTLRDGAKR